MERSEAQRKQMNKRTRTAKACMHCRRRRIKCTGESPCQSCVKLNRACVYECGPKKPRISHKGVITTLKAENQRLRAELQGLRMFSGMAGVPVGSGGMGHQAAPKPEELPFMDAYFVFEEQGLFPLVGRDRFASVLSSLRNRKPGRGASPAPRLSREDTALYFAMLAIGACLRRQEVPAMSYAARVRTILAESFDAPSETMVRVALLLALLHGCMLDVAKEACYLSTALQMLAVLNRVTGKPVPQTLVATAGAICSLSDGPLPFTTPKDLECDDRLRSLACLITQVAGALMHAGDCNRPVRDLDYTDMLRACRKAAGKLAELRSTGIAIPTAYPILINGLQAIALFRLGQADQGCLAVRRTMAAVPGDAAAAGPAGGLWAHPVMAFVLRHVAVIGSTLGIKGGDAMGSHCHSIAMAWPRAAVYFRGLQNDLRTFDESLRSRVLGTGAGLRSSETFMDLVLPMDNAADAVAVAPAGGSPATKQSQAATSAMPALSLRGDGFAGEFDMCFDIVDAAGTADLGALDVCNSNAMTDGLAGGCSLAAARELFNYVQMVTLALGKPFNTCPKVVATVVAATRDLIGAKGPLRTSSPPCSRRKAPSSNPASSPMMTSAPASPVQCTAQTTDCLALADSWTSVKFLGETVAAAPGLDCGVTPAVKVCDGSAAIAGDVNPFDEPLRRNSLTLLCDADHDELEDLLFNLTPDELVSVSLP